MMKKISWIAALFVMLAIVSGCTNLGLDDDGSGKPAGGNPIVEGANYIEISGRTQNYYTIDINTGKAGNLDNFTDGKAHKFTIYGKALSNLNVSLGNTDTNYSTNWGYIATEADGSFTIEGNVPWAAISDTANNKRVDVPATAPAIEIYEIVINDGSKDIYKLSEDDEIQDMNPGDLITTESTLTWIRRAGEPTVKISIGANATRISFDPNGGELPNDTKTGKTIKDYRRVNKGAEIGATPVPTREDYVFIGWFDANGNEFTDAKTKVPDTTGVDRLDLKAIWGGKDQVQEFTSVKDVRAVQDRIVHSFPKFTSTGSGGLTVNTDGSATFDALNDENYKPVKYVFPQEVKDANDATVVLLAKPPVYNVVELTIESDGDIGIITKSKDANIPRYPIPTGDNPQNHAFVEGTNVFSIALSDLVWDTGSDEMAFYIIQRGNGAVKINIVSAVFTKGTVFAVSFDKNVPVGTSGERTQYILSGKYVKKPAADPVLLANDGKVVDFLGWFNGEKKFDFAKDKVTADIDLVSKFSRALTRVVTFDLNRATLNTGSIAAQIISVVDVNSDGTLYENPAFSAINFPTITIPSNVDSFAGWFDMSVDPPVMYVNGFDGVTQNGKITKDVTLTVQYLTEFNLPFTSLVQGSTGTSDSSMGLPPTGTVLQNGNLSIDLSTGTAPGQNGARKSILFDFTEAQVATLRDSAVITIEVKFVTAPTGSFRCGIVDRSLGSGWDMTNLPGLTGATTLLQLVKTANATTNEDWKSFLLQNTDSSTETVVIEYIKVSAM